MSHPSDPPDLRLAARVRAAQAYAALSYDELARRTRIGESTLRRIASSTKPRGATVDELMLIARACEVSPEWIVSGTGPIESPASFEQAHEAGHTLLANHDAIVLGQGSEHERLAALEQYVHALLLEQERRHPELASAPLPPRARRRRRETSNG